MNPIIAIDPGASGAIVFIDRDGGTHSKKMPDTFPEIADLLRSLRLSLQGPRAIIEKVGGYMPGNSGPAAAKFARHCGHIEMACYCAGIETTQVTPQKWMKKLGAFPKDKKARKNAIKQMMQTRYPNIKVTLVNADALGILTTEVDK